MGVPEAEVFCRESPPHFFKIYIYKEEEEEEESVDPAEPTIILGSNAKDLKVHSNFRSNVHSNVHYFEVLQKIFKKDSIPKPVLCNLNRIS